MRKADLNFVVDVVAFVAFVFLAATGVLVRYVLPPGSGHFSMLWGMDRHEWGQLHFWTAVVLMASLGFHLFNHWRWVVGMVKGPPREGSGLRVALAAIGVMALVGLAAAPFFGRVEQTGEPPHRMRLAETDEGTVRKIDGSMTLNEVEQLTGVRAAVILRDLGLPPDLPLDVRLGRLRKEHGFELNDVREVVRRRLEER
ncbi:MAG: hypothetical protein A2Y95_01385 [Deltaproteobacteria bacterium RBG_13_65_10]|nr:MAG: hypothetical protein A2Y95_01385 [Deltaproteobacteria bacterium RBG_13_65_10]